MIIHRWTPARLRVLAAAITTLAENPRKIAITVKGVAKEAGCSMAVARSVLQHMCGDGAEPLFMCDHGQPPAYFILDTLR